MAAARRIGKRVDETAGHIDQGLLAGLRAEVGQHGDGVAAQSRHQQTGQHGIFHAAHVIELAGRGGQLRQAIQGPHGQILPLGKTDELPRRAAASRSWPNCQRAASASMGCEKAIASGSSSAIRSARLRKPARATSPIRKLAVR